MQPGGAKITLRYITREKEADTNIYPSALATHEEVAASPELFMETLEKLHKSIGTKFIGADWKFAADPLVRACPDNGSHVTFGRGLTVVLLRYGLGSLWKNLSIRHQKKGTWLL